MKYLVAASFLCVLMSSVPSFGKGQTLVCTYATGAEIVVDLMKEKTTEVLLKRISPQKLMTQKIYIKNTSNPSEVDDFIEIESKGKKITYSLKCREN